MNSRPRFWRRAVAFIAKVFQGGSEKDLAGRRLKLDFATVRHVSRRPAGPARRRSMSWPGIPADRSDAN